MENFFIDANFSWFLSKLLPYVIYLLIGVFAYIFLTKLSKNKRAKLYLLPILVGPIAVYFYLVPIFEGDFSNQYRTEEFKVKQINSQGFQVIAIPGCPYCLASLDVLNRMSNRTNGTEIVFKVLSSDSASLEPYTAAAGENIKVVLEPDFQELATLAQGTFPSFVLPKGKELYIWSNDAFGVGARDLVEETIMQ